ncbi:hypothetical protein B9Z55_018031 [Caenorhabditis nigoni]|uniref:Peptidase A2 domain-containing protein n=1 Tax=Caenorhabditis nigoni TaxID=1611254 RepID=A0A2G5TCB1_9PELO|nr:hypothetical protein B9Z55_018031 [Caenorhabditis nigoni]
MGLPEESPTSAALPSAPPLDPSDAPDELSEEEQQRLREEEEQNRRKEEQEKEEAEFLTETCVDVLEEQRQLTTTMEDVRGFYTAANNSVDGGNEMAKQEQTRGRISGNSDDSALSERLKLEWDRLEMEKKQLEEENRLLKLQIPLPSLFRLEENQQRCVASMPKTLKTPIMPSMPKGPREARTSPENMPRECFVKETAREAIYDETMHEHFAQDFDNDRNEKYVPNSYYQSDWDTGKSETAFLTMMQQMHMQNQLPDPPKYTAEEKSASMDAFVKTFQMKYGGLSQKQQVVLLESNFLSGKALKVYKGLPEYDKQSFQTVMRRMAERLRVSKEDDSRRAKSKWEQLHKRDGQSIEDYCLAIDEHSKRAFVRIEPEELSSLKCQKLMNAVYDNEMMSGLIESKLSETTEIEHYEVAREIAIRYERSFKERQKNRKKEEASEKKDNNSSLPNNQYQQNSSKMWSQKQNQSRNHQQQFNSPSNNYRSNSSNNNYQFTSSHHQVPPLVQPSSFSNQSSSSDHQSTPVVSSNQYPPSMQPSQKEDVSNQSQSFAEIPVNNDYSCRECNAIGCHAPTCSKAPRNAKYVPTCNRCREKGHSANYCPQQNVAIPVLSETIDSNIAMISTLDIDWSQTSLNEIATNKSSVQYEQGRIAGVDVEILIDSGASLSVMSHALWKSIVAKKGKEWEKNVSIETPSIQNAVAANGETVNLLFQVILETSIRSKTRKIPIYVADVSRNNVILGYNNFQTMGIQLSVEMEPREIRTVYDVQLAPKSHRSVEVRVAGIFDTEKFCLVHPIIDQLATTVCQVNTKGNSFLLLSNRGKDVVFLEKGQIIAHGEMDETEVFENELFFEDSAEQSCPVSEESSQENNVTDSQHCENQSDEIESMSVSESTIDEEKNSVLIDKKANDIDTCQGPPLKSLVDSSTPFSLPVTKTRDKQEFIDSSQLYEDVQDEHHALEIVPKSLKPPPEPILEKAGDVAFGGVFQTKPTCRVKEGNRLQKNLGLESHVYKSDLAACEKELLSQNSHHNNLIQDHLAHTNGAPPGRTPIVLSPGKDPPTGSKCSMSSEQYPKDSKEFFEDPEGMFENSSLPKFSPSPTSCQLPYDPGSSMSLHPMPSTTTDATADDSRSSSPRISSNFQHE